MELEAKKKRNLIPAIVIAIVAVALVIGIFAIVSGSAERRIAKKLDAAEKYLAMLDYDSAIALYEEVLKLDDKNVEAYLRIVDALVAKGEDKKAEEYARLGYENTGDEALKKLTDSFIREEAPSHNDFQPDNSHSEEAAPKREREVILDPVEIEDIRTLEYYKVDFSQEEENFLREVIEKLSAGDIDAIGELFRADESLPNHKSGGFIRFLKRDYVDYEFRTVFEDMKLSVSFLGYPYCDINIYALPIDAGTGYRLNYSYSYPYEDWASLVKYSYSKGECNKGVFNGKFFDTYIHSYSDEVLQERHFEALVKNGMFDSDITITETTNTNGMKTVVNYEAYFSNGYNVSNKMFSAGNGYYVYYDEGRGMGEAISEEQPLEMVKTFRYGAPNIESIRPDGGVYTLPY